MRKSALLTLLGLIVIAVALTWHVGELPQPRHKKTPPVRVMVLRPHEDDNTYPAETEEKGQQVATNISPTITEPPHIKPGQKPRIAIVIDDMGLNLSGSKRAIRLPGFVTLSFMSYATRVDEQTAAALDAGHELMLHMPMEPVGHGDPGPGALSTNLAANEIRDRLNKALNSFEGFDGINNHMGSKFTAYAPGMEIVIEELHKRGLFFLDSRTSARTVGETIARNRGVPTVSRDVFLDDNQSLGAVDAQLEAVEKVARRKGSAVAIGHPHETTLQALEAWIPEAQARGFEFVPARDLIHKSNVVQAGTKE